MEEGREENKLMDRSIDRPRTNSTQDRLETETYDVQVKSGGAKKSIHLSDQGNAKELLKQNVRVISYPREGPLAIPVFSQNFVRFRGCKKIAKSLFFCTLFCG